MNVSELAPDELFSDLIPGRQRPPPDKSVQSQIAPREMPNIPLPKVKTQPLPSAPKPEPQPKSLPAKPEPPVNLFADLIPGNTEKLPKAAPEPAKTANLFADLIPDNQQASNETGINLFADLIPGNQNNLPGQAPSGINNRISALQQEDIEFEKARSAYELARQKQVQATLAGTSPLTGGYSGYPARGVQQQPEPLTKPVMPGRDLASLRKDLASGVPMIRPNEFGSVLRALETGQLPASEEGDLIGKLQPYLNDAGKQAVEKAVLTQQKLKEIEVQAGEQEALQKKQKVTNALDWEASRAQYSSGRGEQVMLREAAKPVTLGQAFSPDEERLNSDDSEVAAEERARQLFYQQEAEDYPVQAMAGMLLGNAAAFVGGTGLYRQGLRALGKKAVPTTTAGILGEGAAVEAAIQMATRQEGEERKDSSEIIKDRILAAGKGAAIGAVFDLGLIRAGDWIKARKDKRVEKVLAEEASAAGYSSTSEYLKDQVEIITTENGLVVRGKQRAVSDLPDVEDKASEIIKGGSETPLGETAERVAGGARTANAAEAGEAAARAQVTREGVAEQAFEGRTESPVGVNQSRVATSQGTEIDTHFEVVDANDLITSHSASGGVNPDYPPELQPRDRSRTASNIQINNIVADLRPEFLGNSPKASDGAPVVSKEGVVESGNGRVNALQRVYQGAPETAERYKGWLTSNAEQFGLDAATIQDMDNPVLVRVRDTPLDDAGRVRFTQEANISDTAKLSPTERARLDADRLNDEDLLLFEPGEGGNVLSASNQHFLTRFAERIGSSDLGEFITSDGSWNKAMADRVQAAIFQKAYDDPRIIELFAEEASPEVKSILNALNQAAPAFARTRAAFPEMGGIQVVDSLLDATNLIRKARDKGQAVDELMRQAGLFGDIPEDTRLFASFMEANKRRGRQMGRAFQELAELIEEELIRRGTAAQDMFGGGQQNLSDILTVANRNLENRYGQTAQFSQEGLFTASGRPRPEATEPRTTDVAQSEGATRTGGIENQPEVSRGGGAGAAGESGPIPTERQPLENSSIDILEPYTERPIHIERTFLGQLKDLFPGVSKVHQKAKKWAQKHLAGSKATNKQTNQEIIMASSGFKHTISGAKDDLLETIPHTKELIENAKYRGWSKETKGKQGVDRVHYYEIPVELEGKVQDTWITVLERKDGKYYYDTAFKVAPDERIAGPRSHRNLKPRHSQENAHQGDGARTTTENLPSGQKESKPYAKSEEVSGGKVTEIQVEAPDGSSLNVHKNQDGTITANGKDIPKGESYVPNAHAEEITATDNTLYSNPIGFAASEMARSLNIGETGLAAVGGGAYGGISSEEEIGSSQWWLDVLGGAGIGATASATGRYLKAWGKGSYSDQFARYLGQKREGLPLVGRGDPEVRKLKKQQQLMRQVIDRQTGQIGEFLAKNFTPEQRAQMADMIENRGIPKEGGLVARQAQELDDFITFTSERMKELGMLPADLATGGYLHRYYSKHLGLDKMFKSAKRQESISGSYTIQRGTEETFNPNYLSQAVRDRIQEYDAIHQRITELEKTSGDLLASDTLREIEDLKFQRQELETIELREYIGVQDGKPHSFIFMPDEVPIVPGMEKASTSGLETPQTKLKNINQPATPATAGDLAGSSQPGATDRVWNLRASVGEQPVLWRDWTKAERTSWDEIEDAGYRFVRGQAEVAHDLSMATMFKKVSDNSDWVSDTPRSLNGEAWVEVPSTKVHSKSQLRKYGALSGKYVKPEVWRAIKHYNQPLFGRGKAASIYRNLLSRWKIYKTVYNPVSHFNNAVSNTQMYYMAGYSAKGIGESLRELVRGESSQYWRDARDVGLFGSDWGSSLLSGGEGRSSGLSELAEKLRTQPDISDADLVLDSVDLVTRFKTWMIETGDSVKNTNTRLQSGAALAKAIAQPTPGVIKKPVKAATDSAKWLYQKEDELFKLAVFIEERKRGLSSYEAMEAANRFFFDYNDLPDVVRKVKDFPIGSPFISYTYLAVPAIIRNAVERPERMLALAAAFETLNYAGLQMDGELEEQGYWERMDNEKAMNPPWMKGRTAWGALNTLHVPGLDGYKLSLANAHALGNPFAGESGKDLPLWPGFMAFWGPDPVGGNPFTRIPYDIIFNEDWKGSPIYSKTESIDDILRKSMNYAYMNIAPSMPLVPGSWHQQKIMEGLAADVEKAKQEGREPNALASALVASANAVSAALGGEQFTGADWRGNEYKTTDGILGSVGVKLRPYRPQDLYLYEMNKIRRDMDQVRRDYKFKTKKAARGAYTQKQKANFKQQFDEDMKTYLDEMTQLQNAYRAVN